MVAFATIEDFEARYRPLEEDEKPRVKVLLQDATLKIKSEFKRRQKEIVPDDDTLEILKIVCCSIVKRVINSPSFQDQIGADVSQFRTDVGVMSESYTFSNPNSSI